MERVIVLVVACLLAGCASNSNQSAAPKAAEPATPPVAESSPRLGNFSISLVVKDLAASKAFYEKLGFRTIPGPASPKYAILQNDTATIGLFEGFIEKNSLTFNPGWDRNAKPLASFDDVREIQRLFKERGVAITVPTDETGTGPAFIVLTDPDGNPVLIDQHRGK